MVLGGTVIRQENNSDSSTRISAEYTVSVNPFNIYFGIEFVIDSFQTFPIFTALIFLPCMQ